MLFRFKYKIFIENYNKTHEYLGEKGQILFKIINQHEKDSGLELLGVFTYIKNIKLNEHEIFQEISNMMGLKIKLIEKEDLFEYITYSTFYHGTTKVIFKGKNNYIYLTRFLNHAIYHAKNKALELNEKPLVVKVSLNKLTKFDFLPDNDIDESNGYLTFIESLNEIGSFIIIGDVDSNLFEEVSFYESNELEDLIEQIHRNKDDILEGDLLSRINSVDFYELVEIPLNELDLNEWDKDEDLIKEYLKKDIKTIPPIIVHKYQDKDYSIVDGIHRANVYHHKGMFYIKAFVGKIYPSI